MGRVTTRLPVTRIAYGDPATRTTRADVVAVEEPLEVRCGGTVITVTMRTPGADIDLVHGYLLAEGVITAASDLRQARYCAGAVITGPEGLSSNTYNVIDLDLTEAARQKLARATRLGVTNSSCGVCGSASIDALRDKLPAAGLAAIPAPLTPALIASMATDLHTGQRLHARTGGTHAAAIFDAQGRVRAHAEDVGRHNAVDKAIGALVRAGQSAPLGGALVVSSRASYEIVQKAAVAGIPVLIAVSAPSSLAVEAARQLGMTLLGFARERGVNVYADAGRLSDS